MPRSKRTKHFGTTPFDDLEEEVYTWVVELRIVTRGAKKLRATQVHNKSVNSIPFKASGGWCTRFIWRKNLILRQSTHIAQKLAKDVNDKLYQFLKFVIDEGKSRPYALQHIGNMDETPMYFDMPGSQTVAVKGQHIIHVKTIGDEKLLSSWFAVPMVKSWSQLLSWRGSPCQKKSFHPASSSNSTKKGGWMRRQFSSGLTRYVT